MTTHHGSSSVHTHTGLSLNNTVCLVWYERSTRRGYVPSRLSPWNPPKRTFIGHIHKNYTSILWEGRESGNSDAQDFGAAFSPLIESRGPTSRFGKATV